MPALQGSEKNLMRLLVFSDSHGARSVMEKALTDHPDAGHVFFLGDGLGQMEEVAALFPGPSYHMVAGNCDWGADADSIGVLEIAGRRVFYTHGHIYHVKSGLDELLAAGRARAADIVLYGHTHIAYAGYEDGLYILNPGTARPAGGSYGMVDITPAGVVLNVVKV